MLYLQPSPEIPKQARLVVTGLSYVSNKINPCVLFRSYVKSVLCNDKCSVLLIQNGSNLFMCQIKPNQYTLIYSTKQSIRAQKMYWVKCL